MAEQTCARRLRSLLGMQPGVETQARNEQALSLAKRLRNNLPADFVVCGDAHERCQLHGTLDAQLTVTAERVTVAFASGGQTDDAGTRDTLPADAVFAAWNDGQSLLALPDGGFARLPSDWLERHGHRVAQFLAASAENRDESAGALGAAAGPALLKLCEDLDHPVPAELAPLRALVHDFVSVPAAPLPADLQAELRDYQRDGVNWLCFLRRAGIGALLADDMGLGKTLQALCAVAGRTLIVAPTSVLYNWANEAARFRPSLRVQTYHGPRRELDPRADLVLTSYALLRLDQQQLSRQRWDTVVLDESQTIRNPQSQVFQAAAALPADWRLALTGTPVENRLTDLWSQFHFLNPGLLGGLADFEQRYGTPITDGVQGAAEALRSLTRPLILRRLKGQVAKELPPRTDVVLRCQLSEEERRVYDTVHAATQREVVQQLDQGGSVLGALAALLRLRQAACHSGLLPGQQAEGSAKVNLLVDTLAEVIAEEHKALVFSQWTGLLDRIEPQLQAAGIDFVRLDGSTRDRQAVVQRFQQTDGPPVMLISLKAGGVGLTLTQADHVFLTDPWWNPAVEDQAADRAHRIGQQRPVLVHRLIAEDTLEERILELQQHKRSLASAALDDAQTAAGLTRQDLLALLR